MTKSVTHTLNKRKVKLINKLSNMPKPKYLNYNQLMNQFTRNYFNSFTTTKCNGKYLQTMDAN